MKQITTALILFVLTIYGCADEMSPSTDFSKKNQSVKQQVNGQQQSNQENSAEIRRSVHYKIKGKTYQTLASNEVKNFTQQGEASWYGPGFYGKKTANGEIFSSNKLTAAHKKLPMGAKVEVTNLSNGKKVIVRINDRGPFNGDRVIDLSRAAAKKIDIIKSGVGQVNIRVIN